MKTKIITAFLGIIMLASYTFTKAQQPKSYTKYVNTFICTAPMNDPKILGYQLPRGWRSWAGLVFPGSSMVCIHSVVPISFLGYRPKVHCHRPVV